MGPGRVAQTIAPPPHPALSTAAKPQPPPYIESNAGASRLISQQGGEGIGRHAPSPHDFLADPPVTPHAQRANNANAASISTPSALSRPLAFTSTTPAIRGASDPLASPIVTPVGRRFPGPAGLLPPLVIAVYILFWRLCRRWTRQLLLQQTKKMFSTNCRFWNDIDTGFPHERSQNRYHRTPQKKSPATLPRPAGRPC